MDAKEKAHELVDKFIPHTKVFHEVLGWEEYQDSAKQCALIAVDECIKLHFNLETDRNCIGDSFKFWNEVKQEIEKL